MMLGVKSVASFENGTPLSGAVLLDTSVSAADWLMVVTDLYIAIEGVGIFWRFIFFGKCYLPNIYIPSQLLPVRAKFSYYSFLSFWHLYVHTNDIWQPVYFFPLSGFC